MVDVCVVGGGPAGLFSAYYCQAHGLKTLLLEADTSLGGRLRLFGHMAIYDLPGQYGISGADYLQGLLEQVQRAKVDVLCHQSLIRIEKKSDAFELVTCNDQFHAKTVIMATGNGFQTPKKLQLVSEEVGRFISYRLNELPKGKLAVAVIGYNPMALDWSIQLQQAGHEVTLFTQDLHKIQPILTEQLAQLNVRIQPFELVSALRLVDSHIAFGEIRFDKAYAHVGVDKQTVKCMPTYKLIDNGLTTVEGLFVAGDVRNEPGKLKLLLGAAHDAMQAANAAKQYLHPVDYYQPIVSTHHPIFKEWNK